MGQRLNLLFERPPPSVPLLFWNRLRWLRWVTRVSCAVGIVVLIAVGMHALRPAVMSRGNDLLWVLPCYGFIAVLMQWSWLRIVRRRLSRYVTMNRFEVCTQCGYPLRGLRSVGSCPECGRSYHIDEVVRCWRDWMAGDRCVGARWAEPEGDLTEPQSSTTTRT